MVRFAVRFAPFMALALGLPRPASALSCQSPGNHVLLPSATKLAPVSGPWLVLHEQDAAVWLVDDRGQDVPLESTRTYQTLACVFTYDLYRPKAEIQAGARFTLDVSSPNGPFADRTFVTSSRSPQRVNRTLGIELERFAAPEVLSNIYPEPLVGESANGAFVAIVTADAPTLMFLELSVEDTKLGSIVEGSASIRGGTSATHAVSTQVSAGVPELVTSAGCARIIVRDAFDTPVYDQELCPDPGEKLTDSRTVEVSEHLIREEPTQEAGGCGCASVGSEGRRTSALGAFAGMLVAWMAARRRRR